MAKSDAYRFANTIWVEQVIGPRLNKGAIKRAVVFSLIPWLLGLGVAAHAGVAVPYLKTPTFYVGMVGVLLTVVGLVYGASQQYTIYDRLASCFDLEPTSRRRYVLAALERNSRFWRQARATAIIFAIGVMLLTSSIFFWGNVQPISNFLHTSLPRFHVLDIHGWYDKSIQWTTFWIVLIFLGFISPTLGTSASIILRTPLFLWAISRESPQPPPALIKLHFGPAAAFHFFVSILWLFCVGLMLYFIGSNKDWLSYLIVAFAFSLGIANLVVPQVAYLHTVAAAETTFLSFLSSRLTGIPDEGGGVDMGRYSSVETEALIQLMRYEDWVYPNHQTYVFVGTYAFSLLGSIFGWSKLYSILMVR